MQRRVMDDHAVRRAMVYRGRRIAAERGVRSLRAELEGQTFLDGRSPLTEDERRDARAYLEHVSAVNREAAQQAISARKGGR